VHVPRLADGVVLPDAPALGLSILTVVFVFFSRVSRRKRVDGVLSKQVFRLSQRRVQLLRAS
jgi:hypothetical protein